VFAGHKDAGRLVDTGADANFLDLVTKNIFHELAKRFKASLLFFSLLLFVFSVFEIKTFLSDGDELLAVVLLELLDHVFINGVN
jgi:hypothetical protein